MTDWANIDLDSAYERSLNIISPLSFETLLLEISCNIRDITHHTVTEQFLEDLKSANEDAIDVFKSNLSRIVKYAQDERSSI